MGGALGKHRPPWKKPCVVGVFTGGHRRVGGGSYQARQVLRFCRSDEVVCTSPRGVRPLFRGNRRHPNLANASRPHARGIYLCVAPRVGRPPPCFPSLFGCALLSEKRCLDCYLPPSFANEGEPPIFCRAHQVCFHPPPMSLLRIPSTRIPKNENLILDSSVSMQSRMWLTRPQKAIHSKLYTVLRFLQSVGTCHPPVAPPKRNDA